MSTFQTIYETKGGTTCALRGRLPVVNGAYLSMAWIKETARALKMDTLLTLVARLLLVKIKTIMVGER